ncbi:MAG: hypothetical protein COB37_03290 [Kordiimonadales bacterium]|nr:MAG: hypothetical protein COB37_03290 [Kordiimonadales bacterium]
MAAHATEASFAGNSAARQAFEKLGTLVGSWKPQDTPNSKLTIIFSHTANKTVLLETWMSGERQHSLTVYHLDGESLLATHYCPQGNQPRLKMEAAKTIGLIKFGFMDATNLANTEQSHQHSLSFTVPKNGTVLLRNETYLSGEGIDTSELKLVRSDKGMEP